MVQDDELILTESELMNKFKEFRKELLEEEKALFVEICMDIFKNKGTEI